jgi:2-dehydropantoate 2-reductase
MTSDRNFELRLEWFETWSTSVRYAIIGTGAVGGFYGARLQRSGQEVHFLARSDYATIRDHGLHIQSKEGDFILPKVHVYQDPNEMPLCDIVLVTLKSTENHVLPQILPLVLKDNGIVLLLQNGLGAEQEVAAFLKSEQIFGGLTFVCTNKLAPGHIHHLDYGFMTLGAYGSDYSAAGISPILEALGKDFENAGFAVTLTEDLLLARWKKLVWNIPFNGLSVILDAQTDEMMANPAICKLAQQLMEEVVAGAQACGREIPASFLDEMLEHTTKMTPYKTSMKLDYDAGRPLEVEAIYGNPLRMAQQFGVELPRIEVLYRQLQFLSGRS